TSSSRSLADKLCASTPAGGRGSAARTAPTFQCTRPLSGRFVRRPWPLLWRKTMPETGISLTRKAEGKSITTNHLPLFAHNGNFTGGHFKAHEFAGGIEIQNDLQVRCRYFQRLVGFAVGRRGTHGVDCDRAGREFLWDQNRERLRTAFGPIIYVRKKLIV